LTSKGDKTLNVDLKLSGHEYKTKELQAETIKRLDENTFECELKPTTAFGYTVTPVVYITTTDGINLKLQKVVVKSPDSSVEKFCNENLEVTGSIKLDKKGDFRGDKTYMAA